jgi:hypothetical protein
MFNAETTSSANNAPQGDVPPYEGQILETHYNSLGHKIEFVQPPQYGDENPHWAFHNPNRARDSVENVVEGGVIPATPEVMNYLWTIAARYIIGPIPTEVLERNPNYRAELRDSHRLELCPSPDRMGLTEAATDVVFNIADRMEREAQAEPAREIKRIIQQQAEKVERQTERLLRTCEREVKDFADTKGLDAALRKYGSVAQIILKPKKPKTVMIQISSGIIETPYGDTVQFPPREREKKPSILEKIKYMKDLHNYNRSLARVKRELAKKANADPAL